MKKIKYFLILIFTTIFFAACDTYPDWQEYVEYSSTYPISGEYIVNDYDIETGEVIYGPYTLYIYNKSFNPTKDSIWIDNRSGHGTSDYANKYKIKAKADTVALTFDCTDQGNVVGQNIHPLDSAQTVTITNSFLIDVSEDITNAEPDSIFFEVEYKFYGTDEQLKSRTFRTAGHRKTGWENPNFSDPM